MTHPRWKMGDVPDVPDPGATQPPTRVDPELLREATGRTADESLHPMGIGTPAPVPARDEQGGNNLLLWGVIVVLVLLGLGAMLSSGVLAGAVLVLSGG
jgi:hypothetical protein